MREYMSANKKNRTNRSIKFTGKSNNTRITNCKRSAARKRRRNSSIRNFLIPVITALVIILLLVINNRTSVNASSIKTVDDYSICYTTITIEKGDTLTSIADKYYDSSLETSKTYLKNLISINHIVEDNIYAGEKLIIYYYK